MDVEYIDDKVMAVWDINIQLSGKSLLNVEVAEWGGRAQTRVIVYLILGENGLKLFDFVLISKHFFLDLIFF